MTFSRLNYEFQNKKASKAIIRFVKRKINNINDSNFLLS